MVSDDSEKGILKISSDYGDMDEDTTKELVHICLQDSMDNQLTVKSTVGVKRGDF